MTIKYKILWVDDNINDLEDSGVIQDINDYITGLGFEPMINKCEEAKEALNAATTNKYDLIISDLNLAHEETEMEGDALINKIREAEIFTEILFYSSQTGFEEKAKELFKDRISFSSFQGDEAYQILLKKIKLLIKLTVQKLEEIDNLRGVIIGATCEIDSMIQEKLKCIFSKQDSKYLFKYAKKNVVCNHKDREKKIKSLNENDYLENTLFSDSSSRARLLNKYLKEKKLQYKYKGDKENFYENYQKNILDVRNKLAHSQKEKLQTKDRSETFTTEQCIKLRLEINKITQLIDNLEITSTQNN